MEENRKKAYRYLLYAFMLDIRLTPIADSASSMTEDQRIKYINYAGATAYLLHNFALAASNDFECFDELKFWDNIDGFSECYPEIALSHFKPIFEGRLLELNQS